MILGSGTVGGEKESRIILAKTVRISKTKIFGFFPFHIILLQSFEDSLQR